VIELRRADADDVEFLVELVRHPEVEPFLSPHQARTGEEVAAEIARSRAAPERFGRILVWVGGRRAGAMRYELANERNRIANLGALAIHPDFRGRKLPDEAARLLQRHLIFDLGFHRLQLEIYGFNERAQRHADRSGFVREGVKRKAYLKEGEWVDSVLYAIVREDLEPSSS